MHCRFLILVATIIIAIDVSVVYPDFSLKFDGINDYVEISDAPELSGYGNSLTFEAWIVPTDISHASTIISKYLHWNTKDWGMFIDTNGLLGFQRESGPGPGGGNWFVYSSVPVSLNNWNHTCFVFDNSNDILNLYLNGIFVGSRNVTVDLPDTTAPVWIGGDGPFYFSRYGTGMFSGYIDDVRIWNVARTNEEIFNNMLSGSVTGNENGLVAYWNFNEGSGQELYDYTHYSRNTFLGSTTGHDENDPTWRNEHSPVVPIPSAVLIGSIGLVFAGWIWKRNGK